MQSSEDKVIQFHIARLKDKNPDVLTKTIQELERFGAKADAALPILEELFRTSDDVGVKKAAQQAGRSIYLAVKGQEEAGK
jgi:DUF1009 family protein